MLEILMDLMDAREENQSKLIRDGLKQIYQLIKSVSTNVILLDLFISIQIIRNQGLKPNDLEEVFTYFCKS